VVTNNLKDYRPLSPGEHAGLLVVFDGDRSAFSIANTVLDIVDGYESAGGRDRFVREAVDNWL